MGWKVDQNTATDFTLILQGTPPGELTVYPYEGPDQVELNWSVTPNFVPHPNWYIYEDELPWSTKGVDFTFTIDIVIKPSAPPYFTAVETTATLISKTLRDEIEITGSSITTSTITGTMFSVAGKHWSGWGDKFSYVEIGESDKTQSSGTGTDIGTMPENKNFYRLDQDLTDFIIKQYSPTVYISQTIYDGGIKFDGSYRVIGDTFIKTVVDPELLERVYNNYQETTNFVANYKYNGVERI